MSYEELKNKDLVFKSIILKSFLKELYISTVLYPHDNSHAISYVVERYIPIGGFMNDTFHKATSCYTSLELALEYYNSLK